MGSASLHMLVLAMVRTRLGNGCRRPPLPGARLDKLVEQLDHSVVQALVAVDADPAGDTVGERVRRAGAEVAHQGGPRRLPSLALGYEGAILHGKLFICDPDGG